MAALAGQVHDRGFMAQTGSCAGDWFMWGLSVFPSDAVLLMTAITILLPIVSASKHSTPLPPAPPPCLPVGPCHLACQWDLACQWEDLACQWDLATLPASGTLPPCLPVGPCHLACQWDLACPVLRQTTMHETM